MKRNLFPKLNIIFLFFFFTYGCGEPQTTSRPLSQKSQRSSTSQHSSKITSPVQLEYDGHLLLPENTLFFEEFSLRKAMAPPQRTLRITSLDGKGHSLLQYIKIEGDSAFRIKESFMEEKFYPQNPETFKIEFAPSTQGKYKAKVRITYDGNQFYDFFVEGTATF